MGIFTVLGSSVTLTQAAWQHNCTLVDCVVRQTEFDAKNPVALI